LSSIHHNMASKQFSVHRQAHFSTSHAPLPLSHARLITLSGFRLKWTEGHVWRQTFEVPVGEEVEFKVRSLGWPCAIERVRACLCYEVPAYYT
jgi:hypothetical protein